MLKIKNKSNFDVKILKQSCVRVCSHQFDLMCNLHGVTLSVPFIYLF